MTGKDRDSLIVEALAGAAPEIGRMLWMLDDARERTERVLKGFNPAHVDFSAVVGGHTVGTLLYHIAAIELDWLYSEVLQTEWAAELVTLFPYDVRDEQGRLTIVRGEAYENYWSRLATVRRYLLDAFRIMTMEDFRRPRRLPDYDVTPEWVLHHLCQHEAEHRSEINALQARAEEYEK